MQSLNLTDVHVAYSSVPVLEGIDLEIKRGEIVCLIGASGCGKSTLLNAIAGLVPVSSGAIEVDGARVHGPSADRVMVFQDDAVFPWMTVRQNVEFGLRVKGIARQEREKIARSKIYEVELEGHEDDFPRQLSGGMRKRVDLARAIAVDPSIILMDEPYGALDALTKERLQLQFLQLCERGGATALFVTHDLEEALFIGDRVVALSRNPGRITRIVDVPFARPRRAELKRSPEFQELRGVLGALIAQAPGGR